ADPGKSRSRARGAATGIRRGKANCTKAKPTTPKRRVELTQQTKPSPPQTTNYRGEGSRFSSGGPKKRKVTGGAVPARGEVQAVMGRAGGTPCERSGLVEGRAQGHERGPPPRGRARPRNPLRL